MSAGITRLKSKPVRRRSPSPHAYDRCAPLSEVRIRFRNTATAAAAPCPTLVPFHFHDLDSRNGAQNGARRFVYAATSPQMAGIVVSNFFSNRFGDFQLTRP